MKLKEIHRTSTFAWSPTTSLPLLATGTVAGALDESFSNESQLEIWAPNFLDKDEFELGVDPRTGPKGVVKDTARFNRLAWGGIHDSRPQGVIAAGMENGELAFWDPVKILSGAGSDSLILRNSTHTGPVRGLDFNPIQTTLLASGGVSGEVYIWDLKDPSKPYTPTPGARTSKLDEITSVAWNQQVQYVLAGASSTGYTVVWDLRGKREVVALAYGGGAGTLAGQATTGGSFAVGGRRGMSDIAWHPDNATRVITASEDDSSPVILVWDLRNARAPEKILTGHQKGVLSLSWCKQDADLLLSCGKDNRALCWNPQTSEIIGELPSADNWAFQVDWCPRNPDLLATAFFDGTIGIHSIQGTNESQAPETGSMAAEGADIFDVQTISQSSRGGTFALKQPPKWLRRPISSSFGFGGKLITISNLPSAQGKNQSSVVHIRKIVTEPDLVERATKLQSAVDGGSESLQSFAEARASKDLEKTKAGWRALLSLYKADSRDELVTLLGFSKTEIAARVAEAVENLKTSAIENLSMKSPLEDDFVSDKPHEPVVSFAEPERQETTYESGEEKTPSEVSASVNSDATSGIQAADSESTTTVPSLFGDDADPGTPQMDGGADFFNSIAQGNMLVPHSNYGIDSSVAATIGSGPSSVTSETMKSNTFKIYPADESETDRLVTKALVLGDFESAVSLCLSCDRFADAILLAVRGGPELLRRTQKAYFEKRTTQLPYLRLFQSIVTNDLADIVQNADLQEWQEIFVVLCTFANQEEFAGLAEELGRRLEFQYTVADQSDDPDTKSTASEFRKNATLTYLAAARLERLVNIWVDELAEEEQGLATADEDKSSSRYSAHVLALQSFVEKVTVFRSATKYEDSDLKDASTSEAEISVKAFKLASLYDRYLEYADLLTTQGLLKEAITFLKLTPSAYKGSGGVDFSAERERLLVAAGATTLPRSVPVTSTAPTSARAPATTATYGGYPSYTPATTQPAALSQPATLSQPAFQSYAPATSGVAPSTVNASYVPSQPAVAQQTLYAPAAPSYTSNTYNSAASLTQPPHLRTQNQPQPTTMVPPPRAANATPGQMVPPPKKQENGGWNDAPAVRTSSRGPVAGNKPAAITSPFPNQPAMSPSMSPGAPYSPGQASNFPPPPRPGSVQGHVPPPPQGHRMGVLPPPPAGSMYPPPPRPASQTSGIVPPARLMSPQAPPPPPRQPTPSQYAPPQSHVSVHGQAQPPSQAGPYARPQQQMGGQAQAQGGFAHGVSLQQQPGPYGPSASPQPPAQQPQGPYAPPPGAQRVGPPPGPPSMGTAPPSQGGPPPRTGAGAGAPAAPRQPTGPPPPKYPPGDRSHIPDSVRSAYEIILSHLERIRQTTPPQQKRLVDDLERRINPLFDALNCETLSKPVVEQLVVLTRAMAANDRPAALAIHLDLLTRGSQTDDIALWMSGIKQLILRI